MRNRVPIRTAIRLAVSAHRSLILVSLPAGLISVLASSYTALVLLFLFSASVAGQFALVERAIGGPIAMIGGAASQVFMAGFGEAVRKGQSTRALFREIILGQLQIGIAPALVLMVSAPGLFPFVFGGNWAAAGLYAQALGPLFLISFVVAPVNMALTVAGHRRVQLAFDTGRLMLTALVWSAAFKFHMSPLKALWLYALGSTVALLAYLVVADAALATEASDGPAVAIPDQT
jgi:O-antigen/teichoic acid export membrane protein